MKSYRVIGIALVIFAFCLIQASSLPAADSAIGMWVRKDITTTRPGTAITMQIEAWGMKGGRKLTYEVIAPKGMQRIISTIESPMDGTDAPLMMNGRPTGQTMGIKRVDDHHSITTLKMNGKQIGISRGTFSADFNTLTIEDEMYGAEGMEPVKQTEIWIRR